MSDTIELLTSINKLISAQKKNSSASSERFNIFQVLNITTDEVRLHSKFLAELLDPNGTHDKGSVFLYRFLEITGSTGLIDLDSVRVSVEYHIGNVTPTAGGRIDILIQDHLENALIIENKIYAGDQENQLLRYFNYAKSIERRGGTVKLIYLTLFEKNASEFSLGSELNHNDYHNITYQETIIRWLEDCVNLVQNTPKLSIAIAHYLQLLKQLTYQDLSMKTNEQVISQIIDNIDNFTSAETISANLLSAKKALLKSFGESLVEKIYSIPEVKQVEVSAEFGVQFEGIEIFLNDIREPKNRPPHILFSFLSNASRCYIEIHPGRKNGVAVAKNHKKRIEYQLSLNDYFGKTKGKIENTEFSWQGEWVMNYKVLDNRFNDLIKNKNKIVDEVFKDLKIIINKFIEIQKLIH
jgi:hypothetical protein